jgi:transcriptional regulator with XRE-family HTH domain
MKPVRADVNPVWRRRALQGLSQAELAKMAGISPQTISNVETGYYKPSIETLGKIALALGIRTGTLTNEYENWINEEVGES